MPHKGTRRAAALLTALLLLALFSAGCALPSVGRTVTREEVLQAPPAYEGEPSCVINGDKPFFTREELDAAEGLEFSELDELGRCGPAVGVLGMETRPTEKRGPIGTVRPSGWHTIRYDDRIEDRYLYNRCHLVGYQLCGVNADPRNLITGTRYMNIEGMLPVENAVNAHIGLNKDHVLYRVTPVFLGDDLLASGVLIEALSVEDRGRGLSLCRYVFNVQPGVLIDTRDGTSEADPAWVPPERGLQALEELEPAEDVLDRALPDSEIVTRQYILNTKTGKFHLPGCSYASGIQEENRELFEGDREALLEQGYSPCGRCKP